MTSSLRRGERAEPDRTAAVASGRSRCMSPSRRIRFVLVNLVFPPKLGCGGAVVEVGRRSRIYLHEVEKREREVVLEVEHGGGSSRSGAGTEVEDQGGAVLARRCASRRWSTSPSSSLLIGLPKLSFFFRLVAGLGALTAERWRHLLFQVVQSLFSHHVMCRSSVHPALQPGRKAARQSICWRLADVKVVCVKPTETWSTASLMVQTKPSIKI